MIEVHLIDIDTNLKPYTEIMEWGEAVNFLRLIEAHGLQVDGKEVTLLGQKVAINKSLPFLLIYFDKEN